MFGRALRRLCPRCGGAPSFAGWARAAPHCTACGFAFEREPGYWVGAMIINTIIAFGLLLTVFVGGWVVFWPDVPWTGVMLATVAVGGVTPIVAYPWSKAIWSAIELSYHELEPAERQAAFERANKP
jgi:uncharacterized protein (DUF983 family)